MRLIDVDAFIKAYCKACGGGCNLDDCSCTTVDDLMKAPTIDAAPVVYGRWLVDGATGINFCSECNTDAVEAGTPFCPECGAKMEDGDEDD